MMTEQPQPTNTRRTDPSRFIPLIIIGMALCLVLVSAVVTRRIDAENKDFEQNVTRTIQAQSDIATGTAQAIMTMTATAGSSTPPPAAPNATPSPTP